VVATWPGFAHVPRLPGGDGVSAAQPRLLDLFSGAGGAAKGYQRAGFYVVGVDWRPQPNYCGDEFRQADALDYPLDGFDAIHASPPCPRYSLVSGFQGVKDDHPDLVGPLRDLLEQTPIPYVIENVPGAPLRRDLVMCGEMFGLRVHRHRIFETRGFFAMQAPHSPHCLRGGRTNCETGPGIARWITGHYADHDDAGAAMGIDWMGRRELANAVPPAYTEHIGGFLRTDLASKCPKGPGRKPRPRRAVRGRRPHPSLPGVAAHNFNHEGSVSADG
jgi:DNA (cytosine-5)-methyltransferase 1